VSVEERSVSQFDADVVEQGGYLYADPDRFSCRVANQRITQAMFRFARPKGRRVIDIGCGDGTYTQELLAGGAAEVLAVDAAAEAIAYAAERCEAFSNARFEAVDIYELEVPGDPYDVAIVRCMLHHLYDAPAAIARVCSVAREVVVCEPNGYNPILKVIEKVSPYHVAHEEKSYSPRLLDRWFEQAGGEVLEREYIGLVPMFSPDPLARLCKVIEPVVEKTPLLRALGCAQYVQRVRTPLASAATEG